MKLDILDSLIDLVIAEADAASYRRSRRTASGPANDPIAPGKADPAVQKAREQYGLATPPSEKYDTAVQKAREHYGLATPQTQSSWNTAPKKEQAQENPMPDWLVKYVNKARHKTEIMDWWNKATNDMRKDYINSFKAQQAQQAQQPQQPQQAQQAQQDPAVQKAREQYGLATPQARGHVELSPSSTKGFGAEQAHGGSSGDRMPDWFMNEVNKSKNKAQIIDWWNKSTANAHSDYINSYYAAQSQQPQAQSQPQAQPGDSGAVQPRAASRSQPRTWIPTTIESIARAM